MEAESAGTPDGGMDGGGTSKDYGGGTAEAEASTAVGSGVEIRFLRKTCVTTLAMRWAEERAEVAEDVDSLELDSSSAPGRFFE